MTNERAQPGDIVRLVVPPDDTWINKEYLEEYKYMYNNQMLLKVLELNTWERRTSKDWDVRVEASGTRFSSLGIGRKFYEIVFTI